MTKSTRSFSMERRHDSAPCKSDASWIIVTPTSCNICVSASRSNGEGQAIKTAPIFIESPNGEEYHVCFIAAFGIVQGTRIRHVRLITVDCSYRTDATGPVDYVDGSTPFGEPMEPEIGS